MMIDATVVSVFQRDVIHKLPGVYPGDFLFPAALPNDFTVTHIPQCAFYIDSGEDTPKFAVPQDPSLVAKSIVNDIFRANIETGPDAGPGIFMVDGWIRKAPDLITPKDVAEYKKEISVTHADLFVNVRRKQENWAKRLVKMADNDWSKTHSHRVISDNHIWAAQYLGLNREYTNLEKVQQTANCPACDSSIRPGVAVCFVCKAVLNPELAKKFGLA